MEIKEKLIMMLTDKVSETTVKFVMTTVKEELGKIVDTRTLIELLLAAYISSLTHLFEAATTGNEEANKQIKSIMASLLKTIQDDPNTASITEIQVKDIIK
jgi:ribosomal protein L7Ae-like RNA K-turn-binding protein